MFAQGGFDAICGNPPFMGGKLITGNFGTAYRDYLLYHLAEGSKGSADLVSYFYLRAFSLLKDGGDFGLIACNTIAEGDTRQVGLERMVQSGGSIYSAHPNMPWPGAAAVVVSPVSMRKGMWNGIKLLGGETVTVISPYLSAQDEWSPRVLIANANQSFQGSVVLGLGFTMSEDEAKCYIATDPKNAEVLLPYLNGDDLNSSPGQKPSRWVVNFFDWPLDRDANGSWASSSDKAKKEFLAIGHAPLDYPGKVVSEFPMLYKVLDEKVRPERQRVDAKGDYVLRRPLPIRWWQYADKRPALYHAIGRGNAFAKHPEGWKPFSPQKRVLVSARVTKYFVPTFVPNTSVFHEKLVVIVGTGWELLSFFNSSIAQEWIWSKSSTLGQGLNFSPSDAYDTFPFPPTLSVTSALSAGENALTALGQRLDALRREIMTSDQIGLTALYNRFHDPGNSDPKIAEMRRLQVEIDNAVRDSYAWQDIDLGHGFHEVGYLPANDNVRYTISEPARIEILKRLSALNRQRWEEEEIAGLHKKGRKRDD